MEIYWYTTFDDHHWYLSELVLGNYDISKMHYDGPGAVPGAAATGYGYDVRVEAEAANRSQLVTSAT